MVKLSIILSVIGYLGLALTAVTALAIGESAVLALAPGPSLLLIAIGFTLRGLGKYGDMFSIRAWLVIGAAWAAVLYVLIAAVVGGLHGDVF